jgi:hypothetical protein
MIRNAVKVVLTAVLWLAAGGDLARAQILYGSIIGNVRDSSDAAVPGAKIQITNTQTNEARDAITNADGSFSFPTVQSGTYDVRVSHEGFQSYNRKSVAVSINTAVRVNVTLQVGAVNETVSVSAEAAALQTDRTEVRGEITDKTLVDVPVPGQRNYQYMLVNIPGITPPSSAHSVPSNPSRALTFGANGGTRSSVNVRIDGASNTNIWLPHISGYVPALESIETVNVVTGTFSAEQGLAGGAAVNVQIKSGTNDFRGSAFWYNLNNGMKAKPFFNPAGARNPKLVYNQYGGTFGGPIKRDRIFFFASYEGTADREYAQRFATVPTAAMKRGDLSASTRTVYDPQTGDPDGRNRTPFAGNIIPANRISPVISKLLPLIPLPNQPGEILANNYLATGGYLFDRRTLDTKVNIDVATKWKSWVRFSILDYTMDNQGSLGELIGAPISGAGGNVGSGFGKTATFTIGNNFLLSPTFFVDAHFGYTLMDTNVQQPRLEENLGRDFLGIPGTNGTRTFEGGWPRFTIGSFATLGVPDAFMPYFRHDPQFQYAANATKLHGSHSFRFGMDLLRLHLNHTQPEFSGAAHGAQGGFNFGGGPTLRNGGDAANEYNSWGSFMLGLPNNYGRLLQVDDTYTTRSWFQNLYFSDKWQATRGVTLSMGLRWEYFPMPTRADRGLERYDFINNKMLVCGVGNVPQDCGTAVSKNNFSPSLGVAWRTSEKMVIRTGFGINYDPWNIARSLRTNYPVLVVLNGESPNSFSWAGRIEQGIPSIPKPDLGNGIIPIPSNYAVVSTGDEYKRSYLMSWNFTIQRELGGGFLGQVGYVGTRQVNQLGNLDLNAGQVIGAGNAGRPFLSTFGRTVTTQLITPVGHTKYNALQASLARRFANGFQVNTAYTWSKAVGVCCNDNSDGGPQIQKLDAMFLNSAAMGFDRRHHFTTNVIYELPFGRGKRLATSGALAALLGGWQANSMLQLSTGTPFTVASDGASLNLPGSAQRADQVKSEVKRFGNVGRGQAFYDYTAFARVTQPRFGTAGFNILRGPGIVNMDLGLFRSFHVTERFKLQFRAEAFNATNTPHFSNPSNNIANLQLNPDGTFRQGVFEVTGITNTGREQGDERSFRLGLRLQF